MIEMQRIDNKDKERKRHPKTEPENLLEHCQVLGASRKKKEMGKSIKDDVLNDDIIMKATRSKKSLEAQESKFELDPNENEMKEPI
ncbi:hypothetical protein H920_13610 [Fukomys damarensis]|uniref:Uncharacterized protein n=1 Tax=Fukomys damarensis TaxID=885580 RepID=A0A091D3A7_FUKDA|nr:hypothetical protein H920_13610 [Fukomys damarensis]